MEIRKCEQSSCFEMNEWLAKVIKGSNWVLGPCIAIVMEMPDFPPLVEKALTTCLGLEL